MFCFGDICMGWFNIELVVVGWVFIVVWVFVVKRVYVIFFSVLF